MRKALLVLVWAAAALWAQEAQTVQSPPTPQTRVAGSGYVGSTTCKTCHPDIWLNFYKNPHYKSIASGKEPPERTGCEGCHGPGKEHVDAHGGKRTIPHAFSLMAPGEIVNDCLGCHARDLSKANIRRSVHTAADVVCTSCHSIHKAQAPRFLLARVQRELCYQCHATVRAEFEMPVKHRVNEGVMECTDCHNPHGTFASTWRTGSSGKMVDQTAGGEEPCLGCHEDKRGPFVYEHPAVRVDGCETCHAPHGSTNAKLLRRPVVYTLCLGCHNGAGTFGLTSSGVILQSPAHNLLQPRFQNCTLCHVRIHGSDADPTFLR
ncbi:MAG TPA: DmsE family decaheme c-type cytochrome [Bryobacteraceae bacterium]|nr:DmsE family decaheme c-type cytochrome [Bryobacteraceae bacterium]